MRWLGLTTLLIAATSAHADTVQLAELPGHITEGRVIVDASPAEIYELVTSYSQWPQYFSDIEAVKVESGGRDDARIEFRSRAIDRKVTVQFDNEPGVAVNFRGVKGPPGGRSSGRYTLIPLDGGKRTQVVAQLYMDVVGPPALFVRDTAIRDIRQIKLKADLGDIAAHFAARPR